MIIFYNNNFLGTGMLTFTSIILVIVASFLIYWFCAQFDTSSSYIGRNMPPGAKGATINAIASSLPELLTSILVMFFLTSKGSNAIFSIGTAAGSAVFNLMMIPAFSIIFFCIFQKKDSFTIEKKTLDRDAIFLFISVVILLITVFLHSISFISTAFLLLLYLIYLFLIFKDVKKYKKNKISKDLSSVGTFQKRSLLKTILYMDFRNVFSKTGRLNLWQSWATLLCSLVVIALATSVLVDACYMFSQATGLPLYFTAIFIAAGATSVPDLILSVKDAANGNASDALSNAFGSNLFNICIGIGLPFFVYTLIYGSIELTAREFKELLVLYTYLILSTVLIAFYLRFAKKINWKSSIAFVLSLILFGLIANYVG